MPYPLVRSIAADGNTSPREQRGLRRRAFANHFKTAGQHPYTEDPIATLVSVALHRGINSAVVSADEIRSRRS